MLSLKDTQDKIVVIEANESNGKYVSASGLNNCTVEIKGCLHALYIIDCTACAFHISFVKGACNMQQCTDCVIKIVW
jgi:hypothetical protein